MAFRIGQKVVCVDDGPAGDGYPVPLRHNSVYTIASFCSDSRQRGAVGVFLCEVAIKDIRVGYCQCLAPDRFRPAVERKTDISIFTAMLKTKQRELCGND